MFNLMRRRPPTSERVCYLHIGPHKTGSTSIQHALFENAGRLAKIGLTYPTGWAAEGRRRRNHSSLARRTLLRLPGALKDAPVWSELDATLARTRGSIIVSSEHFAIMLRDAGWFDRIIGFFEDQGFRVVIVAFMRDQPIWLNSWYTQDQKNFASRRSFAGFRKLIYRRGYMDPSVFLKRAVDHPRVEVRPLSFERATKAGLVRSFLDAVDAPARFRIDEPPRINANFGAKGVFAAQEIMRRVEAPIRGRPDYTALYRHFLKLMVGRNWEATPYIGLSQDDFSAIRERFGAANEAFARDYFGVCWEELAPVRSYERCVFDFEAASEEDRADVMEVVDAMVSAVKSGSLAGETDAPDDS
ncbi:MAG TPA: hypothetical protein VGC51_12065 [Hansschlegelia sp.]